MFFKSKLMTILISSAIIVIMPGCAVNANDPHRNAKEMGVNTAVIGAIAGGIIGHQTDHSGGALRGSLIGGAIGAAAGGTLGDYKDRGR